MGEVRLIDLFRELYVVLNVAQCLDHVEDVCAHITTFIRYLLDQQSPRNMRRELPRSRLMALPD